VTQGFIALCSASYILQQWVTMILRVSR